MRILQVLGTLSFGDAIGNHAVRLKKVLRGAGYKTEIYAEHIDDRLPRGTARRLRKGWAPRQDDIVICHLSDGAPVCLRLKTWDCHKILMYHNITPPVYFEPYDGKQTGSLCSGLKLTRELANSVEHCVTMSEFSKNDLIRMGYPAEKIWVMPACLIPFEDYAKKPDPDTLRRYSDGWTNILFVGRLSPNKKQEDVIRAYAYYKKHIEPKSRLFLVGGASCRDYADALHNYIKKLGVKDVIFPGHISFAKLIALYRCAGVFLCMSEHEGFCVPLAEAMFFDVPIIAYSAAAVPETLGGSGVLLDTKDPRLWAAWIERIVKDESLQKELLAGQRERLRDLRPEVVEQAFLGYIKDII